MATKTVDRDLKWVTGLPREFLYCRGLRHAWNPLSFRPLGEEESFKTSATISQVIVRTLECLRCDAVRKDFFGREDGYELFRKIGVRYGYPDGYQFKSVDHEKEQPVHMDYQVEMYRRFS